MYPDSCFFCSLKATHNQNVHVQIDAVRGGRLRASAGQDEVDYFVMFCFGFFFFFLCVKGCCQCHRCVSTWVSTGVQERTDKKKCNNTVKFFFFCFFLLFNFGRTAIQSAAGPFAQSFWSFLLMLVSALVSVCILFLSLELISVVQIA